MRYDPEVLPPAQRDAMHAAVAVLIDAALDSLAEDEGLEDSPIAWHLPPIVERVGTPILYRAMLVSVITVGDQLARTDRPTLRCVADQVALGTIIEEAKTVLEGRDEPGGDWSLYQDLVYEDMDLELLYDPTFDGIEDPDDEIAQRLGMVNLHPRDWFTPFDPAQPVHPYLADE